MAEYRRIQGNSMIEGQSYEGVYGTGAGTRGMNVRVRQYHTRLDAAKCQE